MWKSSLPRFLMDNRRRRRQCPKREMSGQAANRAGDHLLEKNAMLAFSILLAISNPGIHGNVKSLDLPGWADYIIFPLAVAVIFYLWRKKANEDGNNDDDKPDE